MIGTEKKSIRNSRIEDKDLQNSDSFTHYTAND